MRRLLFILTTLVTSTLFSQQLLAAPVLRIAYPNNENAPRAMRESVRVPAESPGISVELMQMVGRKLDLELQFVRMPWKRCLYLVQHGGADAAFHASYKVERAEYGVYPQRGGELDKERAIYHNRYVAYVHKDSGIEWDGRKFSNATYPVGAMLGAVGSADLRKMGYTVEEESDVRSNFDKLRAGRISAYVEIETIGDSFLESHAGDYADIVKLTIPFSEKYYYLLISKRFYRNNPELSEAIFDAIRDTRQQEEYRAMVKKYQ